LGGKIISQASFGDSIDWHPRKGKEDLVNRSGMHLTEGTGGKVGGEGLEDLRQNSLPKVGRSSTQTHRRNDSERVCLPTRFSANLATPGR
jgi:hypothetical protein